MVDFKRNLAWLDEFRVFVSQIAPKLLLGALKEAGISLDIEAVSTILKEQQNKLTKIDQIMNKISKISAQSGKINLENCNPE